MTSSLVMRKQPDDTASPIVLLGRRPVRLFAPLREKMKRNLRLLENLQDKITAIPSEEWDAAADIVIAQKRQETGNAKRLPSLLNGHEFVQRTLALVEKGEKQGTGSKRSVLSPLNRQTSFCRNPFGILE